MSEVIEKKKLYEERNINLDLIRCFAIFFVISVHFFLNTNYYQLIFSGRKMYLFTILRTFFMICVPLFLLLTGYLMNKKELSKKYYKGIIKVLLTYFLCSVACIIFNKFYLNQEIGWKMAILSIFNFAGAPYAWYIEMYIGLFLLIPFLNLIWKGLETQNKRKCLIITMLILTTLPTILNIYDWITPGFFKNMTISNVYQPIVPDYWLILYPFTYYFIGCYLKDYKLNLSFLKNLIMLIISIIIGGSIVYFRNYQSYFDYGIYAEYYSFISVIISGLFFNLILKLKLNNLNNFLRFIIVKISNLSLAMYLISYIPDNLIYPKLMLKYGSILNAPVHLILIVLLILNAPVHLILIVLLIFVLALLGSLIINLIMKIITILNSYLKKLIKIV